MKIISMNIFKVITMMLTISCGGAIAQVKNDMPSKNVEKAMMYLAFDLATKDRYVFPIQFFKLKNVKKIVSDNPKDPDNEFSLEFNTKGQWISLETKGDNLRVKYMNDAPAGFTNNHGKMLDFYYSGDTAVVKIEHKIWQYRLVGQMFLDTESYPCEKGIGSIFHPSETSFNHKKIRKTDKHQQIISEPADLKESDYLPRLITTYSHTSWNLPLSIDEDDYAYKDRNDIGNVKRTKYFYDTEGNLVMDVSENGFTTNHVFKMKNGLPVTLTTRWKGRQMKGTAEEKPEITNFSYTFFR
ncbi:hypothetical protein HDE68_003953 [Pedobacter cryoconitis]|uniref:YD repeat-containing protein n=1 Tax=Pedobacter cryoconitis TaxID=188932 RepID=A0A7W8ZQG0_9SPHI|nr:hypothetical protein [Pedobacter cryoconitis]MBB5638027.1 hypothetical protein [Pedobacter cryoconitis]